MSSYAAIVMLSNSMFMLNYVDIPVNNRQKIPTFYKNQYLLSIVFMSIKCLIVYNKKLNYIGCI